MRLTQTHNPSGVIARESGQSSHHRRSGTGAVLDRTATEYWMPAFAGMTLQ
jgi:hypothetical protein